MLIGIVFIITGVIMILINNSEFTKDYIEKHNFENREEILMPIRNLWCYMVIGFGVLRIIYDIVLRIKG